MGMLLIVVVGLLFNPGALVMRTRQSSKQQHHLPLAASPEVPLEQPNPRKRRKGGAAASTKRSAPGATMPPLLDLGKLVRGTLVKRPSASIRSPYVADVSLQTAKKADDNLVLAHAPALDVGGMCVPGSEVFLSKRDGGKTSHAIELVRGAPLTNKASDKGVLVGAHPRLGELVAQEVLKRGLLKDELKLKDGWELGAVDNNISMNQQVTLGDSRVDFVLTISNNETTHKVVVEVKNVVCADYASGTEPQKGNDNHCVVVAPTSGRNKYQRSALFPWGRLGQKYDGKAVVSERAIKHIRNLQSLSSDDVTTVVMFIVNRSDCESIRACGERCPVFRDVLKEAVMSSGVKAVGVRVLWQDDGCCHFDGFVPVVV